MSIDYVVGRIEGNLKDSAIERSIFQKFLVTLEDGKYTYSAHEVFYDEPQHKEIREKFCLHDVVGGGRVQLSDGVLKIGGASNAYGSVPYDILLQMKEGILKAYQEKYQCIKDVEMEKPFDIFEHLRAKKR